MAFISSRMIALILSHHALAERQIDVDAGGELAHQAGPQHAACELTASASAGSSRSVGRSERRDAHRLVGVASVLLAPFTPGS